MEIHGVKVDRTVVDRIRDKAQTRYSFHRRPGYSVGDHLVFVSDEDSKRPVTVELVSLEQSTLGAVDEAAAKAEGFTSVEAFRADWDGQKRNRDEGKKSAKNPAVHAATFKVAEEQHATAPNVQTPVEPAEKREASGPLARKKASKAKTAKTKHK